MISVERAARDPWPAVTVATVAGAVAALAMGRLGVPPVDLHPPTHYLGIMDPGCGMTRASAALDRGDLVTAWRYNPGVFAIAAAGVSLLVRAAVGVRTGTWWQLRIRGRAWWLVAAVGLVALEVNQQLHAELLRG